MVAQMKWPGKACKKYILDQKQKDYQKSPVVPTFIRDGRVGTFYNRSQKDMNLSVDSRKAHLIEDCLAATTCKNLQEMQAHVIKCQSDEPVQLSKGWQKPICGPNEYKKQEHWPVAQAIPEA